VVSKVVEESPRFSGRNWRNWRKKRSGIKHEGRKRAKAAKKKEKVVTVGQADHAVNDLFDE